MSDVDALQNAEEQVEQREQEARQREQEERRAKLMAEPLRGTATRERKSIEVPMGLLRLAANIRTGDLKEIDELAISLREVGLLHPLLVRAEAGAETYKVVAGKRRFAALKLASDGDSEFIVRCELIEDSDDEAEVILVQLSENIQREDMPPLQVAKGLRAALTKDESLSASQLARLLGKSPAWVSRHLHLLDLPETIQHRLDEGDLNFTIADLIRQGQKKGVITDENIEEVTEDVVAGDKTVDELKAMVRPGGVAEEREERKSHKVELPDSYHEWAREDAAARSTGGNQAAEPNSTGMDAEQRDWESDDEAVSGASSARTSSSGHLPAVIATATPDGEDRPRERGAREVETFLLARVIREWADSGIRERLGLADIEDFDAHVWDLAEHERQELLFTVTAAVMDSSASDQ